MNEQWAKWIPDKKLAGKYYIDEISDNQSGFKIILSEADGENKKVHVLFKNSIDAYRSTDESFRLTILNNLKNLYGSDFYKDWTFFKVTNSEYLKWLSEESCEISDDLSFMHFSFIAADSILDVITNYEPEICFFSVQ